MFETTTLILALLAGVALGAIFFGGLWWTVRFGLSSAHPAVCFLGSYLLRTAVSLAGFYFVSRGDWRKLLACLLGFFIARLLVTRFTGAPLQPRSS
jgi:F1F0 ATPase subunit 2